MRVASRSAATAATFALVLAGVSAASAQPEGEEPSLTATATSDTSTEGAAAAATEAWADVESESGRWIVQLEGPSAVAQSPSATDLSASAQAQVLADQARVETAIEADLGRQLDVVYNFENVLNGIAVELAADEVDAVRALPGVLAVYPDVENEVETDVSHELIGTASIWDGDNSSGTETRGEGVVVAMIDSGVNPGHPAFAAEDEDGYVHENPIEGGGYLGSCDPDDSQFEESIECNDKLIGAYYYAGGTAADEDGHGSHVGSTIAGNKHTAEFSLGGSAFEREIQGVAPRANVISYRVCAPGCFSTDSIAAVNQAIADGVDVVNYSISGSPNPWADPVDLAFLDAQEAGLVVSASAGNSGPGAGTTAHNGPWNLTVGASTHDRVYNQAVSVVTPEGTDLTGLAGAPSDGTQLTEDSVGAIVSSAELAPGNPLGCTAFEEGLFDGSWVLIPRGECAFGIKVANAEAAGAEGVIFANNTGGPPTTPSVAGSVTTIPAVQIAQDHGVALHELIVESEGSVEIEVSGEVILDRRADEWPDIMAGFSSRGPTAFDLAIPTITAPGVGILAAVEADGDNAATYAQLSGTSMSSPHAAGNAALLTALHPEASPTEIRSIIATTATVDGLVKEDEVTPTDTFDLGSGRIDLDAAGRAGLVLDETAANFRAANPAAGGEPRDLNLPAFVDQDCQGACTWTRTVESISDAPATYTASFDAPDSLGLSVEPAEFTLEPGATQELTITADVSSATLNEWTHARISLDTASTFTNGAEVAAPGFPVAVITTSNEAPPEPPTLTLDPEEITSEQPTDTVVTETLTIGNTGDADLTWEFIDQLAGETVVLWDQEVNGTSGIVSDYFTSADAGVFSADDFTLDEDAAINLLETPGFWIGGTLAADSEAIDWEIYSDDDGTPGEVVWSHTSTHDGDGVSVTGSNPDQNIALDLDAAGTELELEAGTYWLSVWPTVEGVPNLNARWNWYQGTPTDSLGMLIDPDNLFGAGASDWTPIQSLVTTFSDLAFTIEGPGPEGEDCGGDWVSVDPTSGTTAPDGTTEVSVELDSTGLEPGEYTTQLCLSTNDPANGQAVVPVTLTVTDGEVPPGAEVQRVFGEDRWSTAAELTELFPDGTSTVYIANAEESAEGADALTGGAAAARGSLGFAPDVTPDGQPAPIMLVKANQIPLATAAAIEALGPDNAIILGGSSVVSEGVEASLVEWGIEVQRVEGADRYETSANLALNYPTGLDTVYVATGQGDTRPGDGLALADALTAASLAGSQSVPVLLTRTDHLPAATAEALTTLDPANIVVIGGNAAVNEEVEELLAEIAPTSRLAGDDRYQTAIALTQDYAVDGDTLYIASGQNFPDALAGAALTGSENAPLLVVNHVVPAVVADEILRLSPQGITIIGGESAVSESVELRLQELLDETSSD